MAVTTGLESSAWQSCPQLLNRWVSQFPVKYLTESYFLLIPVLFVNLISYFAMLCTLHVWTIWKLAEDILKGNRPLELINAFLGFIPVLKKNVYVFGSRCVLVRYADLILWLGDWSQASCTRSLSHGTTSKVPSFPVLSDGLGAVFSPFLSFFFLFF